MNALDQRNAAIENAPLTVWWADLVALKQNRSQHCFSLCRAGCCEHFRGCEKAKAFQPWDCGVVETSFWTWHSFTLPSNRVASSAAQFNSSVSITPPLHLPREIKAFLRRRDGYTAKG
jgi:hypothetical protein